MATATSFTSTRMKQIEDTTITSGLVDSNGDLILRQRDNTPVNAGNVRGLQGEPGIDGAPTGAILAWAALGIPDNWLECNGEYVTISSYPDLFAVIGYQYGSANGGASFCVPNLQGRVPVGYDTSQSEFNVLGKDGGEKTHLLTIEELAAHRHKIKAYSATNGSTTTSPARLVYKDPPQTTNWLTNDESLEFAPLSGGDQPHNNLQPYQTQKYIIKARGGLGQVTPPVETILSGRIANVEARQNLVLPVFECELSATQSWSGAQNAKRILFNKKLLDQGNNFNTTLNRFVAPVDGMYEFHLSIITSTTTGGPAMMFYKNGVKTPKYNVLAYNNQYMAGFMSEFIQLNAGDYVEAWHQNANGVAVTISNTHGTYFSGKLLR